MNIFELASRNKFRFTSTAGNLTTEQLWDLPLINKGNSLDLDTIARTISVELKSLGEHSFVDTNPDRHAEQLALGLEIVKHIIATKLAIKDEAKLASEKATLKQRLLEALANKEDAKFSEMSIDEIKEQLNKL